MLIDTLIQFQYDNPDIYVGGSVSLILQNAIPYRTPKDIDIISPIKTNINDVFKTKTKQIKKHIHGGLLFELFNNLDAKYVEYNYNGFILKLSPIEEVFEWKLKRSNNKKHLEDIKFYKNSHIYIRSI